jgi:hypothetical protein
MTGRTLPPDDPWAGYARVVVALEMAGGTRVVIHPAPFGEAGAWPWPSRDTVHVLTAWDPGDERPGLAANQARQASLEAALVPLTAVWWPASGWDPDTGYRDVGLAVQGVSEDAVRQLGARYGQDAVFAWTPSEWAIVACRRERRVTLGWTLS